MQTQIRLLLEQSDQGLQCLLRFPVQIFILNVVFKFDLPLKSVMSSKVRALIRKKKVAKKKGKHIVNYVMILLHRGNS